MKTTKSSTLQYLTVSLRPLTLCALLLLSLASSVLAQRDTDGTTPSGMAPGSPAGSYALSGFENVNLFNGHLNFRLPLLGVQGRGGAGYQMTLPIEQTWTVFKQKNEITGATTRTPQSNWWDGIKPGYGPGVLQARKAGIGNSSCGTNQVPKYSSTLTRLTFTGGDGTEYEFRDQLTGGLSQSTGSCTAAGFNREKVFYSADGSSATFISDNDILDTVRVSEDAVVTRPSGYLLLSDGTRYRVLNGLVTELRDRNGNLLTFTWDTTYKRVTAVTDSLGRQVTVSYAAQTPGYDEITFKGFGVAARSIRVNYVFLGNALRTGYELQTERELFPEIQGSTFTDHNPRVVKSVTLPNDGTNVKEYQFWYNSYGELARVVLPTGGAVEYEHAAGVTGSYGSGIIGVGNLHIYRRVVERRTYPDGGTGSAYESKTVYSRPETTTTTLGYVVTDLCTPSGTTGVCGGAPALLGRQRHYFNGSARASFGGSAVGYTAWKEGKEYQTDTYGTDGVTLLRSVTQTWRQPVAGASWPLTQAETSDTVRENNPQVTQTETILADSNQYTKQTFSYDRHNNRTDTYEYHYGVGASGLLARHTQVDYLTTNYIGGQTYNYADPASGILYAPTDIHIRSLTMTQKVYPADPTTGVESATPVAQSETLYDQYSLTPYSTISGWADPFTAARGNATTQRAWVDTTNTWLETHATYDQVGNLLSATDAKGNVSTISYTDSFSDGIGRNTYAFPTLTTSAIPAPNPGPYAGRSSATALTASTVYDYSIGLATSTTDANSQTTHLRYKNDNNVTDQLDRLRRIERPDGGVTKYNYGDAAGNLHLQTLTYRGANQTLPVESRQDFDGLGRAVRSFLYEGSQWITSDTQYDALGRAWKVSANPYLSAGPGSAVPPSGHWVENTFDALGRVTKVKTTADGAEVITSYDGNTVTVTDQMGKKRKSITDALGRLTQVVEAPEVATCQTTGAGCATNYKYDALGNLRKVEQGGQSRFFAYDSLSRLIRAKNPEQGDFAADADFPALTDATSGTSNSGWSVGYTYDAGGNLSKRKDARNVVTTHSYDNLNRLIQTAYSDSTPYTLRTYDFATNGRGLFYADYESSTQGTLNFVLAYDAAGLPTSRKTDFYLNGTGWVGNYTSSRTYDKMGNVETQTYPSGRTVTNTQFDAAGRLKAVSGNLGDGMTRTYSDGITYDDAGRVSEERFGTQTPLYHKLHYNVRGQLYDVRLSTVAWATDQWNWNRGCLALYYGGAAWGQSGAANNGNVTAAQHWVPGDDQITAYSYTQQAYAYDPLNRLSSATETAQVSGAAAVANYTHAYKYDRFGNREIDLSQTWVNAAQMAPGVTINTTQFAVNAANNRLGVPAGQGGSMAYDNAGNLTADTYSASAAQRAYDAENRMTLEQNSQTSAFHKYTYDAGGKRVRRDVGGNVTWQVYGFDGELLAEYAQNSAPSSPRKEYGYRGGELLITAGPQPVSWQNAVGVSVSGNSLTKTGGVGWTSGASSAQSIASGDGYVEFTASETNTYRMAGLSNGDSNQDYPDIDFALYPTADGGLYAYEGGVNKAYLGGYAAGDRLKVMVEGGVVKYARNGAVLHTSGVAPTYPLRADTSLYSAGATIADVVISAGGAGAGVRWLVSDHLGTPRMTVDATGSLSGIRRHDYLPFGEEIGAGVGGRTQQQGYISDNVRQGYTSYEKDGETGLNYARARYHSPVQGRFTGVDPILSSVDPTQPQSWNRYTYCLNNPLKYIDPTGLKWVYQDNTKDGQTIRTFRWIEDKEQVPDKWTLHTGSLYFVGTDEGLFLGNGFSRRISKDAALLGQLDEFLRGPNSPLGKEQKEELQRAFARRVFNEHWEIEAISAAVGGALGGISEGALKGLAGLFVNQGIRNTETALLSGMLRAASKGKGNFGIGSATVDQAEAMGRAWVGPGYRVASDGKTLVSLDGLRQFRPPSFKPSNVGGPYGTVQANFEWRPKGLKEWQGNAHVDIVP